MTLLSQSPTVRRSDLDEATPWRRPPAPSALPTIVVGDGPVVALRKRAVVALGSLADRVPLDAPRLVSAHDLDGRAWWIPACAVWSDADSDELPQHPFSIGLVAARSRDVAVLAGLSNRLGWEANEARLGGRELPTLVGVGDGRSEGAVLYDGRLGHDVPTVVLVGDGLDPRWGAGSTVDAAYQRALYGHHGGLGNPRELDEIVALLADAALDVVTADLGTPLIKKAGVLRFSVQLMVPSHEPGRPWDADSV